MLVVAILEIFLYAALKLKFDYYSFSNLTELRSGIVQDNTVTIANNPSLVTLHPYLGYVYDPARNSKKRTATHWGLTISDYGFLSDSDPFHPAKSDSVVIGIFGGSVAFYFSVFGVDALVQQLQSSDRFKNKEIKIVRVALGGYKQPQQLMALAYFLSQGAHFDAVINLDGFNEVALPPMHNIPNNVSPFYPRSWHWQSDQLLSNKTKSIVGKLGFLREGRTYVASTMNGSVLRFSNIMNAMWMATDGILGRAIGQNSRELSVSTNEHSSGYARSGPTYSYEDNAAMYRDLAAHWSLASQQMAKICEANQILYWHFLQPNQYVPGAKTLSDEELEIAFNPESPYREHAEVGYSSLIEAGQALARSNAQFHDLTMVFKDYTESVYSDDCCHLNEHGNEILGDIVGRLMVEDIGRDADYPKLRSEQKGTDKLTF